MFAPKIDSRAAQSDTALTKASSRQFSPAIGSNAPAGLPAFEAPPFNTAFDFSRVAIYPPDDPGPTSPGDGSGLPPWKFAPECGREAAVSSDNAVASGPAKLPSVTHLAPRLQAKLTINEPGDQYEQEADRVADQVMRMPDPASVEAPQSLVRRSSGVGSLHRTCAACEEADKQKLSRKESAGSSTALGGAVAPPIVREVLRSPSQQLDPATRAFFEPRIGYDFSTVRIHSDPPAARAAHAINAMAYTIGNDIAFGQGKYAPNTDIGGKLLAHELAHVVQQSTVNARVQRETDSSDGQTNQSGGSMAGPPVFLRMPNVPVVQRTCSSCEQEDKVQRKCAKCEEEEALQVKRKALSGTGAPINQAPASVYETLRSPGQPLDTAARSFFEPRFGLDLGHIRVHTDARAAESARAVNALAYCVGPDIVFSQGGYAPAVHAGKALLAHELAHTIQQQGATSRSTVGNGTTGQNALAAAHGEPMLQRSPGPESEDYTQGYKDGLSGAPASPGPRNDVAYADYNEGYAKGHSEFQQKAPATPSPQAPAAKQAIAGIDSKGQGYVVYENEIRVGGTRTWRNNNPGNFDKAADHPTNIGNDGAAAGGKRSFLIFPDTATGKQELTDSIAAHGTSTIRSFITVHAPPNENDTEKYIREVVGYVNNGDGIGECRITKPARLVNDGTSLGSFTDAERSNFAMAMAREEGFCDVTQKKTTYNCQSASIPEEYKGKLTCPK